MNMGLLTKWLYSLIDEIKHSVFKAADDCEKIEHFVCIHVSMSNTLCYTWLGKPLLQRVQGNLLPYVSGHFQ